jgi:hypothetical protein
MGGCDGNLASAWRQRLACRVLTERCAYGAVAKETLGELLRDCFGTLGGSQKFRKRVLSTSNVYHEAVQVKCPEDF